MPNATNSPYPLSKDEEKGLLYGSLISAGISALSGGNIPEAIQNAIMGFGTAYSGGLINLLKMKEDELKALREQEELNLNRMSIESNVERNKALTEQAMYELELAKSQEEARKKLAEQISSRPELSKLVEAGEIDNVIDILIKERTITPQVGVGPGGEPYFLTPTGKPLAQAYQISQETMADLIKMNEYYTSLDSKAMDNAFKTVNMLFPKINPNLAYTLVMGELPGAETLDKLGLSEDDVYNMKRTWLDTYLREINKYVSMGQLPPEWEISARKKGGWYVKGSPDLFPEKYPEPEPEEEPPPAPMTGKERKAWIDKESKRVLEDQKKFAAKTSNDSFSKEEVKRIIFSQPPEIPKGSLELQRYLFKVEQSTPGKVKNKTSK